MEKTFSQQIAAIEQYRDATEKVNREYYEKTMPTVPGYFQGVTVEFGKKNARVVMRTGGQSSVIFFVEIATGDILKSAGWKAPAKGARGNVATTKPQPGTAWLYR